MWTSSWKLFQWLCFPIQNRVSGRLAILSLSIRDSFFMLSKVNFYLYLRYRDLQKLNFGLLGNMIRVIESTTAARGLFKSHTNIVTDIRLKSDPSDVLGSIDADGNLLVWQVSLPPSHDSATKPNSVSYVPSEWTFQNTLEFDFLMFWTVTEFESLQSGHSQRKENITQSLYGDPKPTNTLSPRCVLMEVYIYWTYLSCLNANKHQKLRHFKRLRFLQFFHSIPLKIVRFGVTFNLLWRKKLQQIWNW